MKKLFPLFFVFVACSNPQLEKELETLKTENTQLKIENEILKTPAPEHKIKFVQIVKFKSLLTDSEVTKTIHERKLQFLEVPGLVQKYYMQEKTTGEYSGVYLWASEQDFLNYKQSELGKTIGSAYRTDGRPRVELFEMLFPLREN